MMKCSVLKSYNCENRKIVNCMKPDGTCQFQVKSLCKNLTITKTIYHCKYKTRCIGTLCLLNTIHCDGFQQTIANIIKKNKV